MCVYPIGFMLRITNRCVCVCGTAGSDLCCIMGGFTEADNGKHRQTQQKVTTFSISAANTELFLRLRFSPVFVQLLLFRL